MSSGVSVNHQCLEEYNKLKMKSTYRYIIYGLSDDLKEVITFKSAPSEATYDDFVADLKAAAENRQCRYAVYDAEYETKTTKKNKILFFYWGPEDATTKQKMVYSASKEKFRSELGSGLYMIEAHDDDEISWKEIETRLVSGDYTNK